MKKLFQIDEIRFYELLFRSIIWVLMVYSIIALVIIHLDMFQSPNFEFSVSRKSIEGYLDIYVEYRGLFTSTVAVIVAYLGLQRLKVASEANRDKLKQDHFSEWKMVLDLRLAEIGDQDPLMRREIIRSRQKLFMQLYELNFNIENKKQLENIFDSNFGNLVDFFESQNKRYMEVGGFYPDMQYSYTGQNFAFVFGGCIDNYYDNLYPDLLELYSKKLPESRLIDLELFNIGSNRWRTKIF